MFVVVCKRIFFVYCSIMEYRLEKALEILEQKPSMLKQFLLNLSDEWIFCNEEEGIWSAFDIIGYLIHGENTDWITRTNIILNK